MDNNEKFINLRKQYREFIFERYEKEEDEEIINITYYFSIPNLENFNAKIKIKKKEMNIKNVDDNYAENMIFHIGLIELISYWKCTCAPHVIIKCGNLNEEQIKWFKKLYFYGLGELFFTNNIKTNIDEFMTITCEGTKINLEDNKESKFEGYIVPIGGGKDSIVTLETLNLTRK